MYTSSTPSPEVCQKWVREFPAVLISDNSDTSDTYLISFLGRYGVKCVSRFRGHSFFPGLV